MDDSRGPEFARVDEEKRAFLKKLALGTAYAVPVIATFSLDSIRSKAHAQSVYSDPVVPSPGYSGPVVLSFRAALVPSGRFVYSGPPPEYDGSVAPFFWVITYDRPMDPAYSSAKICRHYYMGQDYACDPIPTTLPEPEECGSCADLTWEWHENWTQERAPVRVEEDAQGKPTIYGQQFIVWLNHASCPADKHYRDTSGNILKPFVGVADLCEETET